MNGGTEQDNNLLALEEIKILSDIIGRIEDSIYKRQAWLFALITGLALAVYKDNPIICKTQFFFISIFSTTAFLVGDVINRIPAHRAIDRSRQIEQALRDNENPESPKISASLSDGDNYKDFFKCIKRFRVLTPYIVILLIIIVITLLAP